MNVPNNARRAPVPPLRVTRRRVHILRQYTIKDLRASLEQHIGAGRITVAQANRAYEAIVETGLLKKEK
jgi:hypothetical protein